MHGIFEPRDARVLQHAPGAARLAQRPALRRVDHDPNVRPDGVTDGAHAVGLALGGRFLADPELHRVEAVVDVAPRRRRKLIGREAVPEPVAAIRRQTIAIAAEQAM